MKDIFRLKSIELLLTLLKVMTTYLYSQIKSCLWKIEDDIPEIRIIKDLVDFGMFNRPFGENSVTIFRSPTLSKNIIHPQSSS